MRLQGFRPVCEGLLCIDYPESLGICQAVFHFGMPQDESCAAGLLVKAN